MSLSRAALSAPAAMARRPSSKKPNILLLMADQLRGDCLGADGNNDIQTPNLDRLASEGGKLVLRPESPLPLDSRGKTSRREMGHSPV